MISRRDNLTAAPLCAVVFIWGLTFNMAVEPLFGSRALQLILGAALYVAVASHIWRGRPVKC